MKTALSIAALCALFAAEASEAKKPHTPGVCEEVEAAPGTRLADGTVAGEKQAIVYLKERDPSLLRRLQAFPPAELRKEFGKYFVWFQRVGPCRQLQKEKMALQLKDELRLKELVAEWRSSKDSAKKAALRVEARKAAAELFDREVGLMDYSLESLEYAIEESEKELEQLRKDARDLKEDILRRRDARNDVLDRRLRSLLP